MRSLAAATLCAAVSLVAAQPQSLLVRNVTHACQNQRRSLAERITAPFGGDARGRHDDDDGASSETLRFAVAQVFGFHPSQLKPPQTRKGVQAPPLPKLELSAPCMKSVSRIVDLARKGDQTPIKQLACSLGLHTDDTGDFYTCEQMTYPAADGSDAGLSYWTMSLGHHDTGNNRRHLRMMQETIEGKLVPDESLAVTVAEGLQLRRQRRQLQHGGYHPKIGLCFPSECSHTDLWNSGPHYLQSLRLNATTCDHDKGTCPGEPHATKQSNATQFWIESIEMTGGHTQFGMVDFGAIFWIAISVVLLLLTACATTPEPFGVKAAAVAAAAAGKADDRSNTDPAGGVGVGVGVTSQLRGAGPAGNLIQSGGEAVSSSSQLKPVKGAGGGAPSLCVRLARNWDMSRNYLSLHKPDPGHAGLKILNGIRVLAIFLVVLGHTFAFMRVDNDPYARNIVEKRFMTRWLIGERRIFEK